MLPIDFHRLKKIAKRFGNPDRILRPQGNLLKSFTTDCPVCSAGTLTVRLLHTGEIAMVCRLKSAEDEDDEFFDDDPHFDEGQEDDLPDDSGAPAYLSIPFHSISSDLRRDDSHCPTSKILARLDLSAHDLAPRAPSPAFVSSHSFFTNQRKVEYFIPNVLAIGQHCVIGGPMKALKTTILINLAISLQTGAPFLGFPVARRSNVILMSGESGESTLRETAHRIGRSHGINVQSLPGLLWSSSLPNLCDGEHLALLEHSIRSRNIGVVAIDPVYLAFGGDNRGRMESLFDVGERLTGLSAIGQRTGTTFILAHHLTKKAGEFGRVPELADLQFSGFGEWARSWILLGRRRQYDPSEGRHELLMNIGGSAGHGGRWTLTVDEGPAGSPVRSWRVFMETVEDARQNAQEARTERQEGERAKKANDAIDRVLAALRDAPEGLTPRQARLRTRPQLKPDRFDQALRELISRGMVTEHPAEKRGGKPATVIRLKAPHQSTDANSSPDTPSARTSESDPPLPSVTNGTEEE